MDLFQFIPYFSLQKLLWLDSTNTQQFLQTLLENPVQEKKLKFQ